MRFGAGLFLVSVLAICCAGLSGASAIETVIVTAPKDVDQAVHDFVHTYAKPTPLMGKMARWSKGAPLCPNAVGLTPDFNSFIIARIRQVADMVGAPLQTKLPCKPNMVVLFTPQPQALLDVVRAQKPVLLGYHSTAQMEAMTRVSHPIQAWYATATRDYNGTLRLDDAQAFDACVAMYGAASCSAASMGTRVFDGMHSEMAAVTVVADANKIAGLQIGALADYIAMLALSQTQTFEACLPLASIANLMTADCEGKKAQSLTESDLAYLKALYKINPDVLGTLQTSEVSNEMRDTISEAAAGKKP
jgi:hypothetical protein